MKLSEQYFLNTMMLSHDDEDDYDDIMFDEIDDEDDYDDGGDILDIMFDEIDDDNDWGF